MSPPLPHGEGSRAAPDRRARLLRLVLLGWAIVLLPGGLVDIAVAAPDERVPTFAVIVGLGLIVLGVARYRPGWLGPMTVLLGLGMAAADPFEPGPPLWRLTTMLADLGLAAAGVILWRARR